MIFILEWFIFYLAIVFSLCLDNIFWIPTSSEYEQFKSNKFPLKIENTLYNSKIDYVFRYRILSLIKSWRDITPALISSLILSLIFNL